MFFSILFVKYFYTLLYVQVVFEGVAKDLPDPFRKFRGYVAVDNIAIKQGLECKSHCTFEGGFCGWINNEDDDFNWSLVINKNNKLAKITV